MPQVFCCDDPTMGAHNLLSKISPAAAEPTTPSADSGAFATTSDIGPNLQHSNLDLDLDVYGPHGLGCVCGRGNRR